MTRKIEIHEALLSLRPNSTFVVKNNTFDGIDWRGDDTPPTKEEIEIEMQRLQDEYDSFDYQRKRVKEYPPLVEQLDMLYHLGYDGWKKEIEKIKIRYPKIPK